MFDWFKRRRAIAVTARELYGAVVTQARETAFYRDFGVADTAEGRYELVALHLVLVLERLGQSDIANEPLRRKLLETFITDMDDSMREMGVGDIGVAKRVKKAAGGIYTRAAAYRDALAGPDDVALHTALKTYLYEGRDAAHVAQAAGYVTAAAVMLRLEPAAALTAGRVRFIVPDIGAL